MASAPLQPNGNPVRVGNVVLRTPGLSGQAVTHLPTSPGLRAIESSTDALRDALAASGVVTQETVELAGAREVALPASAPTRSTAYEEPAIEVTVPDAGKDWGQFLLAADESGVLTWHLPVDGGGQLDATRGAATRTYVLRRIVAPLEEHPRTRGLLGALGKKILKVLAFKLLDPIGGAVGEYFVSRWEHAKRPHRFRSFLPASFASADVPALAAEEWPRLAARRALLFVHGTNSRTHIAFSGFSREVVQTLHERYQGRVFAFDHLTLSEDPRQNAEWFLSHVPDGTKLDVDIVCHSRGGLVARWLAERSAELALGSRALNVGRVVFVAVPNGGTILADGQYMGDFIDSYTNLLNFLPDNGVTESFEGLVTVMKQLAVGTLEGLDGLQSMRPGGPFLADLNRGVRDGKQYFALAADFEPTQPGWKAWAADRLLDKIFRQENDLVVPTLGVYDQNGSGFFPIADRIGFGKADGVAHSGFFRHPRAQAKILEWLPG